MKQKIYVSFFAALLFLGGCGEDEPECLCRDDGGLLRKKFISNARGIVGFHPALKHLIVLRNLTDEEGEAVHFAVELPLPDCSSESIHTIGTEIKLSGYFLEGGPLEDFLIQPFCYTELEIINANEPK